MRVIKAIIVDDEWLALNKMERMLQNQKDICMDLEVIGAFQDPNNALEFARQELLDVAFLDIEMPEINGCELAEQLLQIRPHLHIVFVTAYSEHAVKAFELNALDYLLKPVNPNRLAMTLERIAVISASRDRETTESSGVKLCCLKSLHYLNADSEQEIFPWKTLKAPELFAYLIYYRDKMVSKQVLMDLLWPGYDSERASTQLHTAIYQIRKVLKTANLPLGIKYKDEGYRLEWGDVRLDVEEWEQAVSSAPAVTKESLPKHLAIMQLYTGDYLEEHRYLWAEGERNRISLIWLAHVKEIAECYVRLEQYTEAILLYQKIVDKFPEMEDGYFGLMRIYETLHHSGEVRRQYQLVTHRLEQEYNLNPSKELQRWYQQWEGMLTTI